ncbi:class I SAM-dependent methyltransferase [Amycolatopsis pithecellobii]|uniref:Methyltransferase domain-containing protein n=1 Tax=Amycolatopsis pithecellobii TaxID=664692 RepID=A0A6N7ZBD4_9PSEU|nr:class I SAM-dependent methyltransferase [Amycolatopsis pithecellobii]MTD59072.1 methyltransferase domain-containing protein [Amycolatopsis pithecellobii]
MKKDDQTVTEATALHSFDAMLTTYERWAQPCSQTFSRAALDGAALPVGATILDVCAGMGALAVPAAELGHRGWAIDVSPGMIERAAERLKPHAGWSTEVMDALDLHFGDNEFDAAFSVLGVVYFGPETGTALEQMVRVVRPGGVISVVNWAEPLGATFFIPVSRAVDRFDDPEVGKFVAPLTEFLEGPQLERALSGAGCVDVRSESVSGHFAVPSAEIFMEELDSVFQVLPQYRAAIAKDRDRFRDILVEEVLLMASKELPPARANIAYGRVPTPQETVGSSGLATS